MQKVPPDACRISARPGKGEKTAAVKSSRISFQTDEKKFREGEEHPAGTAAPDRAVCLMRVDPAYFALRARAPLRQNPSASGGFLSRRAVTVFALPMAKTSVRAYAEATPWLSAEHTRSPCRRFLATFIAARRYTFPQKPRGRQIGYRGAKAWFCLRRNFSLCPCPPCEPHP